jgi:hypothetical protein
MRLTCRVDDLIARNASQSLPMATSDSESSGLLPRISSFAEMDFLNEGNHHP